MSKIFEITDESNIPEELLEEAIEAAEGYIHED